MPKLEGIKRVLVIGSGPIIIGQAAEFDYAGTQACRALKEEGLEVVLVNSNPATIMTDSAIADHVYIEPLTLEFVKRIIEKEKPDSILSTLGGQTGLTLSMELAKEGFLKSHNVTLLGASPETRSFRPRLSPPSRMRLILPRLFLTRLSCVRPLPWAVPAAVLRQIKKNFTTSRRRVSACHRSIRFWLRNVFPDGRRSSLR